MASQTPGVFGGGKPGDDTPYASSAAPTPTPRRFAYPGMTPNMTPQNENLASVRNIPTGQSESMAPPGSNIRALITQKEKELVMLSQQRIQAQESRAREMEESVRDKEIELQTVKQQLSKVTNDYNYNLKLLEDRDAELERLDRQVIEAREQVKQKDAAVLQLRSSLAEKEVEVKQEQTRVAELETYYKEKLERLLKQVDETRADRDEKLRRAQEDAQMLEKNLQKQMTSSKDELETERRQMAMSCEETVRSMQSDLARKQAALEEDKARLHRELADLRANFDKTRRQLADEQGTVEGLRSALETAETYGVAVSTELEESKHSREGRILDLEREVQALTAQREVTELEAQAKVEEMANSVRDYESNSSNDRKEAIRFQEQLSQANVTISNLELQVAEVKGERDKSQQEYTDRLIEAEHRAEEAMRELQAYAQDIFTHEEREARCKADLSAADDRNRELKEQIRRISSDLEKAQESKKAAEKATALAIMQCQQEADGKMRALRDQMHQQTTRVNDQDSDAKQNKRTEEFFAALRKDREAATAMVEADPTPPKPVSPQPAVQASSGDLSMTTSGLSAAAGPVGSESHMVTVWPASMMQQRLSTAPQAITDGVVHAASRAEDKENAQLRSKISNLENQVKNIKKELPSTKRVAVDLPDAWREPDPRRDDASLSYLWEAQRERSRERKREQAHRSTRSKPRDRDRERDSARQRISRAVEMYGPNDTTLDSEQSFNKGNELSSENTRLKAQLAVATSELERGRAHLHTMRATAAAPTQIPAPAPVQMPVPVMPIPVSLPAAPPYQGVDWRGYLPVSTAAPPVAQENITSYGSGALAQQPPTRPRSAPYQFQQAAATANAVNAVSQGALRNSSRYPIAGELGDSVYPNNDLDTTDLEMWDSSDMGAGRKSNQSAASESSAGEEVAGKDSGIGRARARILAAKAQLERVGQPAQPSIVAEIDAAAKKVAQASQQLRKTKPTKARVGR